MTIVAKVPPRSSGVSIGGVSKECSRGVAGGMERAQPLGRGLDRHRVLFTLGFFLLGSEFKRSPTVWSGFRFLHCVWRWHGLAFAAVVLVWAVDFSCILDYEKRLPHGAWATRGAGSLSPGQRELLDDFSCFRVLLVWEWLRLGLLHHGRKSWVSSGLRCLVPWFRFWSLL